MSIQVKTLTQRRPDRLTRQILPPAVSEIQKAGAELDDARTSLAAVQATAVTDSAMTALGEARESLAKLDRTVNGYKQQHALVGQKVASLQAQLWLNGEPLTNKDIEGKVVLLDFWAVWCGPCIMTFPHLREYQKTYSENDLVIVGITRRYEYIWDEQTQRPKDVGREVTADEEREMLKNFARRHGLSYRLAVDVDRTLSDYYGVVAIPHFVVIDRHGTIRKMLVGSDDATTLEIAKTLAELIGER